MPYAYTNGDGLAALILTEPDGASEPVSNLDDAIRQIKAYLADPTVGPDAKILIVANSVTPAGIVRMFAGGSIPSGYLECDGSAVSRVTYASLFTAIGTTFGPGDSSTTFNLPDFRGRSPIGVGTGDAVTSTSWGLGEKGGEEMHILSIPEMPGHGHNLNTQRIIADGNTGNAGGGIIGWNSSGNLKPVDFAGGDQPHNNLHPVIGIKFIIKT